MDFAETRATLPEAPSIDRSQTRARLLSLECWGTGIRGEGTGTSELSGVDGEDHAGETGELWEIVGSIVTLFNRKERD